jgi:hypothetical protein
VANPCARGSRKSTAEMRIENKDLTLTCGLSKKIKMKKTTSSVSQRQRQTEKTQRRKLADTLARKIPQIQMQIG